jgi:hypothetical protein
MSAMDVMMWGIRGLAGVVGFVIVVGTVISAIKTFVLPRGACLCADAQPPAGGG